MLWRNDVERELGTWRGLVLITTSDYLCFIMGSQSWTMLVEFISNNCSTDWSFMLPSIGLGVARVVIVERQFPGRPPAKLGAAETRQWPCAQIFEHLAKNSSTFVKGQCEN